MAYPLRRLIEGGPLPASLALGYLDDILGELELAHSRGGPKGRIAPESIVVVSHEREPLKARFVDDDSGAEAAIGTAYASPEQLEGQPATEASDIFSVGVVAYEMLTGRHPFGRSDGFLPPSLEHNILREPPSPIEPEIVDTLSPQVPGVLARALAKDPADRFADVAGFREALKAAPDATQEPVTDTEPETETQLETARIVAPPREPETPPSSPPSRGPGWGLLRLVAIIVPVVAIAILAAGLVLAYTDDYEPADSTTIASESTTTSTSDEAVIPVTTTLPAADTSSTTTTVGEPVRVEQDDPSLSYAGEWKNSADPSASGGVFVFADSDGASVIVSFEGTYLAWIAKRSPVYGQAEVALDGRVLGTIDLYSADTQWQAKVWGSGTLEPGLHTVIIARTGDKNAAAQGTNICVDAFDVTGTLVPAE